MKAEKSVVQEAEALLEKITPGPWAWEWIAEKSNEWAVGQAFDGNGNPIEGQVPEGEWVEETVIERRTLVGMNESGHANAADAEFIAAAPRLVRALLAEQHRLEAENRSLRESLDGCMSGFEVPPERFWADFNAALKALEDSDA